MMLGVMSFFCLWFGADEFGGGVEMIGLLVVDDRLQD